MAYPFKTFIPATTRTKTNSAIQTILERHAAGETATAIVAPPRWGKADIIRLSAMEAVETGIACAAIVFVPWVSLAGQMITEEKVREMIARYMHTRLPDMPDNFRGGQIKKITDNFHETSILQHLFTSTIQMANSQLYMLERWLDRCISHGTRPIVFIDEGQLMAAGKNGNTWGNIAQVVQDKGAHLVLLTGTPYRADGEPIPGFKLTTLTKEDVEFVLPNRVDEKHISLNTYRGIKGTYKLTPHLEITLKDAWEEEALCKIEPQWIDATMDDKDGTALSSMKHDAARKNIREVSTAQVTIAAAAEKAYLDMTERRKAGMKSSGILVVTTSDIETGEHDGLANWHARRARDAFKSIDPSLQIAIATQANEPGTKGNAGANAIEKFSEQGIGDILIVKNMGTVGLDCRRLKTIVLLGTARQLAGWVQAILRGGTTWGKVTHFTLILTDDIMNRSNWDFVVGANNGEYVATDVVLVDSDVVESPQEEQARLRTKTAEHTHTGDSHNDDTVTDDTSIHQAMANYPLLRERMSQVEIQGLLDSGAIFPTEPDAPVVGVVDTGKECARHRVDIEVLKKKYVNQRVSYGSDKVGWLEQIKYIGKQGKIAAGIRGKTTTEVDPIKLKMMVDYLERMTSHG